jgi:hypothetical protein
VALDASGNLQIADTDNSRIREIHFAEYPLLELTNITRQQRWQLFGRYHQSVWQRDQQRCHTYSASVTGHHRSALEPGSGVGEQSYILGGGGRFGTVRVFVVFCRHQLGRKRH